MMNKVKTNILFALAVIVLFTVPVIMIIMNNLALKRGTEYLFKVEAFDPYDMLRGNYIYITFENEEVKSEQLNDEYYSEELYVTIKKDKKGYAYFDKVSLTKPENTDYYKTSGYYSSYSEGYRINTPTRYYMNEDKSLEAEKLYEENIDDTYVKVRVHKGNMVIVGVYIGDNLIDNIA